MFNSMFSFGLTLQLTDGSYTVLYSAVLYGFEQCSKVAGWLAFSSTFLSPKVPVHCRQASPLNRSPNVQCLGFGAACGARFPWDGNDLSINVRRSG